jgi:hypothetical protein
MVLSSLLSLCGCSGDRAAPLNCHDGLRYCDGRWLLELDAVKGDVASADDTPAVVLLAWK